MKETRLIFTLLLLLAVSGNFYPVKQIRIFEYLEEKTFDEFSRVLVTLRKSQGQKDSSMNIDSNTKLVFEVIDTCYCFANNINRQSMNSMRYFDQLIEILGFLDQFGKESNIDWNNVVLEEISLDMEDFFSEAELLADPLPLRGQLFFSSGDRLFVTSFTILMSASEYHLVSLHSMN